MSFFCRKSLLSLFLLLILSACNNNQNGSLKLSGSTMGTTYNITIVGKKSHLNAEQLQGEIEARLATINQEMSTYIDDSEISRFNQYARSDWFPISGEFLAVVQTAIKAHQLSGGAFDPTIYPLVDLWGFAKHIKVSLPSDTDIQIALKQIGLQHLKTRQSPPALSKDIVSLSLDLSAIAKGYGVDALAKLLSNKGFKNYLVEIGGEVYAAGKNANKKPWHIAIEKPDSNHLIQSAKPIQGLYLQDQSVATSGNYRNFYEYAGKRYAHTLDPNTGRPAENTLASVTVIHASNMWADAMATTMMVMGAKQGLAFANKEKLAVFMVIHHEGNYKVITNAYFNNLQKRF